MRVRVRNIKLRLDQDESQILYLAARQLGVRPEHLEDLVIVRKSVDARRNAVHQVYAVDVDVKAKMPKEVLASPEISLVQTRAQTDLTPGNERLNTSPVIIGAGPAGLFCALTLARHGYKPILLERGPDVDRRVADVESFWRDGILNPESNVQYGEGGAGTFSDGKLTTRIGDERVDRVLETFVRFGASPEITYLKKPHVGTDRIREIVKEMRREIINLGGEVYFQARVTDLLLEGHSVTGVVINDSITVETSAVILAIGNSARDVFRMLGRRGVSMIQKGFAVGVRIEHPQTFIDKVQYGAEAGHPSLGPADYHMTYQDTELDRALYTFCMCPGGQVIAASSEPGQVVTNGMSLFARDSGWANSALVVTVPPGALDNTNPLAGVEYQEQLETRAFVAGGGNYNAPAQTVGEFLTRQPSVMVGSTYRPGVTAANLWEILPHDVATVLARGLKKFGQIMPGFSEPDIVMTGVETRTSCPLRVERDADCQSVNTAGLYPCGEGAGYAGGIVSAAVDGIRIAENIIKRYARPQKRAEIEKNGLIDGAALTAATAADQA